jgi:hypothetical protein
MQELKLDCLNIWMLPFLLDFWFHNWLVCSQVSEHVNSTATYPSRWLLRLPELYGSKDNTYWTEPSSTWAHGSCSLTLLRKRYSDMVLYFPSSQNAMWNCLATKTFVNPCTTQLAEWPIGISQRFLWLMTIDTLELHRLLINRTCGLDAQNYTVCSHSQSFGGVFFSRIVRVY